MTTQVILNGQRVGVISPANLATFLRVSTMEVVSHTLNAIVLSGGTTSSLKGQANAKL